MKDAPEEELELALAELEQAVAAGRWPGRWEARAVLIPLGRLVLARGEAELGEAVARLREAASRAPEAWEAAVREELSLACAEHVQGTDPRYLGVQGFDWAYVLSARERLEARVVGARALGMEPPEALWGQVQEADLRVREHAPGGHGRAG